MRAVPQAEARSQEGSASAWHVFAGVTGPRGDFAAIGACPATPRAATAGRAMMLASTKRLAPRAPAASFEAVEDPGRFGRPGDALRPVRQRVGLTRGLRRRQARRRHRCRLPRMAGRRGYAPASDCRAPSARHKRGRRVPRCRDQYARRRSYPPLRLSSRCPAFYAVSERWEACSGVGTLCRFQWYGGDGLRPTRRRSAHGR